MIINNQTVIIRWNNKHKRYYESLGYKYTGNNKEFEVDVKDLSYGSRASVLYECDYCGLIFNISYKKIQKNGKHPCLNCISTKRKETVLNKYGVDNVAKIESIQQRIQQTNIRKYGCANPMQNDEIKQKAKETNLKKYGVEYTIQSDEVKQKIKETNLKKYGVEYVFQSDEIKQKIKATNLNRYGVEHVFQSEIIKEKIKTTNLNKYNSPHNMQCQQGYEEYKQAIIKKYGVDNIAKADIVKQHIRETLYKNGTAPCSQQQMHINNLLGGELNYPVSYYSLDIAFPSDLLYVEYDGSGHDLQVQRGYITEKQFIKKEMSRKNYLQGQGWKIIRIISRTDRLYSDDMILTLYNKAKQYLLNTTHTWVEIDIDNNEYRCSQYIEKIN